MKRILVLPLALLLLAGCAADKPQPAQTPDAGYQQIDQETAKQMLAQADAPLIVDVRRLDEYESGHIPGALCIPNESIGDARPEELPNPAQPLLIYCRSGNRSKQASEKLARLGYSAVYEFGGILDWTGEIVTGQSLALTLQSNPTTGYSWQLTQEPECFTVHESYTAAPQDEPMTGAGGWQRFLFEPLQPGTAELRLRYSRPWEPSELDPELTLRVELTQDGSISVLEDGSEAAEAAGCSAAMKLY